MIGNGLIRRDLITFLAGNLFFYFVPRYLSPISNVENWGRMNFFFLALTKLAEPFLKPKAHAIETNGKVLTYTKLEQYAKISSKV